DRRVLVLERQVRGARARGPHPAARVRRRSASSGAVRARRRGAGRQRARRAAIAPRDRRGAAPHAAPPLAGIDAAVPGRPRAARRAHPRAGRASARHRARRQRVRGRRALRLRAERRARRGDGARGSRPRGRRGNGRPLGSRARERPERDRDGGGAGGVTGALVTVEGVEGAGKTTQSARLTDALRRDGLDVVLTREPGGTELGRALRRMLLDETSAGPTAETELLLYLADRAEHVRRLIVPALERGAIVVADRFSDSTVAYQSYGRGLPIDTVRAIDDFAR